MSMNIISRDSKICCWGKGSCVMKWFMPVMNHLSLEGLSEPQEKSGGQLEPKCPEIPAWCPAISSTSSFFLSLHATSLICSSSVLCDLWT